VVAAMRGGGAIVAGVELAMAAGGGAMAARGGGAMEIAMATIPSVVAQHGTAVLFLRAVVAGRRIEAEGARDGGRCRAAN
jgi:hypothetical protein